MPSFKLSSRDTKDRLGDLLPFEAPLGVEVSRIKAHRTNPQNDMLWALLRELGNHIGMTAQEMYDECACECFGYELVVNPRNNSVRKRPNMRPSKADRDEFGALIDLAQRWCAEEGIVT